MNSKKLTDVCQAICDHSLHRFYEQRQFDLLNGYELVFTRCENCHKPLSLKVKKIA
ncbi:MAG: hypothetical protein ACBZ72_09140 [Candidatus Bathyarchaeia archaeon]|jgi:hypothetical protein